ncbi:MAG: hypothetical protein WC554_12560 [Clostridia bacterium]
MKKLIAESLQEYREINNLLIEEQINEGITEQYAKLNKTDEASVRKFAEALSLKKYVPAPGASADAAHKLIKQLAASEKLEQLVQFLDAAAADKFAGRTIFVYANPTAKQGRLLSWKKGADIKPENQFKSGGTGGHTTQGGV